MNEKHADRIRNYVRDRYVLPARQRGDRSFKVVAGDVHRELGLHSRVPAVCAALRSAALRKECRLRIVADEGPESGQSTTVTITYEFEDLIGDTKGTARANPLWALRGAAKELFRSLGGGEAFIRSEREAFNSREKQ